MSKLLFFLGFSIGILTVTGTVSAAFLAAWEFDGNLLDKGGTYHGVGYDHSFANDPVRGQVLYLNGEAGGDSYVDIPGSETQGDPFDMQSQTVMVWAKLDTNIADVTELWDEHSCLVAKGDTQFRISRRSFENRMMWNITGSDMGYYDSQAGPEGPLDGQWHHYTGTYNAVSGEQNFYVDGVLESGRTQVPLGVPGNNNYTVQFGRNAESIDRGYGGAPRLWIGSIDDAYIYNHALTQGEIQDVMNNGFNPPPPSNTSNWITATGNWLAGSWDNVHSFFE